MYFADHLTKGLSTLQCWFVSSDIAIVYKYICFPWRGVSVHVTAFWDHLLTCAICLTQKNRTTSPPKQSEYFRKKENVIEKNCGSHDSKVLETSLMFSIFFWKILGLMLMNIVVAFYPERLRICQDTNCPSLL